MSIDLTATVAQIMADDGWTCEYHEPNVECITCKRAHRHTAEAIVRAVEAAIRAQERKKIAGWLAEVASAYRDVEADATATALDKCAVDLEADR